MCGFIRGWVVASQYLNDYAHWKFMQNVMCKNQA